jgi:NAD+ kinase
MPPAPGQRSRRSGSPARVLLLADCTNPEVNEVVEELRPALNAFAEITMECGADAGELPPGAQADFALAVGGDGTLITQARRIVDLDVPLIGVNMGRLGFLAEFDPQSLIEHAEAIFTGSPRVHEYSFLAMEVLDERGERTAHDIAMNDGVITAGEPFRMIELLLRIDGTPGPVLNGDGVVVATPVGSTAYNVAAGGPIVHPRVEAIAITPLAPHSLAFRPLILRADSELRIDVLRANPGTAVVADGRVAANLKAGDSVLFRRDHRRVKLVVNPGTTYWRILLDKLRWAVPPTYRQESVRG